MKKISLLRKVGIGLGTAAVSVPLVLTATSCSKTSAVTTNYISFNRMFEDKSLANMSKGHYSNDTILFGSDKFSGGDYILFVGSNTFDASRSFFAGKDQKSKDVNAWFTNLLPDSIWYNDVVNYPNKNLLNTNFSFVTFIDNFDFKFYDKDDHEYYVCEDSEKGFLGIKQNVRPFEKWTKGLIAETKAFMKSTLKYDWDDEAVSEDDYIRQDKQAKAYRSFCERGLKMFPTSDDRKLSFITDDSDGSLMVIYKDGKIQEIVNLPADINRSDTPEKDKDSATLLGAINKHYADIEDEPE